MKNYQQQQESFYIFFSATGLGGFNFVFAAFSAWGSNLSIIRCPRFWNIASMLLSLFAEVYKNGIL